MSMLLKRLASRRCLIHNSRQFRLNSSISSPVSSPAANIDTLPGVPVEYLKVLPPASASEYATKLEENQPQENNKMEEENVFISMFRNMSPYINVHRGRTFVIHICGQLVQSEKIFNATMHDIALLNTFGIKLVLVVGARPQMNERLRQQNIKRQFDPVTRLRITGPEELKCAMDASGSMRVHIESILGRGLINAPGSSSISIASGNFLSAQPVGVRGGIDYKYTGEVRRINEKKVRNALDGGDIVLISNLGYSASGEIFNCMSEQVASKCASQLGCDKLIYLHDGEKIVDSQTDQIVHTLLLREAENFVEFLKTKDKDVNPVFVDYLKNAIKACSNGVQRSHLVSRNIDGGLLAELFTRDGSGIMIFQDIYEGVRTANTGDIAGIMRLIQPLLDKGILVSRNQEQIETNVKTFSVVERDGAIIACAALQPYENYFAEIACVAVDPAYSSSGKGNSLLGYLLRKARSMRVKKVFVLTTQTAHWFLDRGFIAGTIDDLPASKLTSIDQSRKSKVYIMDISNSRAVDERELLLQLRNSKV